MLCSDQCPDVKYFHAQLSYLELVLFTVYPQACKTTID